MIVLNLHCKNIFLKNVFQLQYLCNYFYNTKILKQEHYNIYHTCKYVLYSTDSVKYINYLHRLYKYINHIINNKKLLLTFIFVKK